MEALSSLASWIKQETSARRPRLDATGVVKRTASVLLLLLPGPGGPELLFEVRSRKLDWQPGDICFPGGSRERSDRNFAAAAVRETSEELGIRYEDIRLCGTLDFFASHNGFMVYPFVGIWQPGGQGCNPLCASSADTPLEARKQDAEATFSVTGSEGRLLRAEREQQAAENHFLSSATMYPDYKNWRFNKDEVDELFALPLRELLQIKPEIGTVKVLVTRGNDFPFALVPHLDPAAVFHKDYTVYFYVCKKRVIWGMTAAILHSFLERFGKGLKDFA